MTENVATITAVCRSDKKRTKKEDVKQGLLKKDYGLINDAHADWNTHRQVSLLATESIQKMRDLGFDVGPGDFAENLTTQRIALLSLDKGTRLLIGRDVVLEISQIGKECHTRCAIYRHIGKCIMPTEGIFATVIRGGFVQVGDSIRVINGEPRDGEILYTENYQTRQE